MKFPVMILCALPLVGCAHGASRGDIEKVPVAAEATGLMLTARPAEQVADCIGQAYQSAPQPLEGGYSIGVQGRDTSYRVLSFADPLNRYATRVDVLGRSMPSDTGSLCLLATTRPDR